MPSVHYDSSANPSTIMPVAVYKVTIDVGAVLRQLATVYGGTANLISQVETREKKRDERESSRIEERERERKAEVNSLSQVVIKASRNNVFARARGCTHRSRGTWHGPRVLSGPASSRGLRKRRCGRPRLMGTSSGQHGRRDRA